MDIKKLFTAYPGLNLPQTAAIAILGGWLLFTVFLVILGCFNGLNDGLLSLYGTFIYPVLAAIGAIFTPPIAKAFMGNKDKTKN